MTTVRAEYRDGMFSYNVEQSINIPTETRIIELQEIVRQANYEIMMLRQIGSVDTDIMERIENVQM